MQRAQAYVLGSAFVCTKKISSFINILFRAISLSNLPIDPNEPVYCYCRQVSFGEMVACDNDDVSNDSETKNN